MARFRGQPRLEIKDAEALDFLLNTIRCPHKLLPCCHPGTYARTLYVVHYGGIHTVVPVHYTMATKACVGKTNLTATDVPSIHLTVHNSTQATKQSPGPESL